MEINGAHTVAAARPAVWAALNDPEVLRRSLPGCESVVSNAPGEFEVVVAMQVGPLKARFNGSLAFTEQDPPASCVMVFKGQGGAVGFAQGSARVTLEEQAGETVVRYTAEAHIGGRLAQLGSRMIESVARRSSDQFFSAFQRVVGEPLDGAAPRVAGGAEMPEAQAVATVAAAGAAEHSVAAHGAGLAYLVPAWWLFVATAVGAGLAMAAFVVAR